ncbi:MAG: asparagine synthase-related protein, partial [Planctomycetaceae bacterium]
MNRLLVPVVGALLASLPVTVPAQDGTAFRSDEGVSLPDAGDGVPRFQEDTGWSTANFDAPRWAVTYGTDLRSTPWAAVLQGDRTNAAFTAGANKLTLDLAGHTYTIQPFLSSGNVKGGWVIVSDRLQTGASLTIANGTFNNAISSSTETHLAEAGTAGRLTLENAVFRTARAYLGTKSGAQALLTLNAGGRFHASDFVSLGTFGAGSIELRGANSELTAGDMAIGSASGQGVVVLRDPSARFHVFASPSGVGDLTIANKSTSGITGGLRVEAGTAEIDNKLILGNTTTSSGVVSIEGGTVIVNGSVHFKGIATDTTGAKVFLRSGRLQVTTPTVFAPVDQKQFYWEDGTLAFSAADVALTETQLRNYTRQGATSYGGDRTAGSIAGGQILEAAEKLTLSGGEIGLAGGTIRAGTELVVNAPISGHGTLDAVMTGTGTVTNLTTNALVVGALGGSNAIVSSGELRVGSRSVDATYSGTSSGSGTFVKDGDGTQTVTGLVSNTGGVEVGQGTLAFDGFGLRLETTTIDVADGATARFAAGAAGTASSISIGVAPDATNPARLEIADGSVLDVSGDLTNSGWIELTGGTLGVEGSLVNHGRLVNNGTLNAVVSGSGTLTGNGLFTGLVDLAAGATVAPGQSPGQATFADLTLGADGNFELELAAAAGTAGTDWDLAVVTDLLTIAATAADPFVVLLKSLDDAFLPGALDGFDPTQSFSWKFLAATISNPETIDLAAFHLDATDFIARNDLAGGTLSIAAVNDGLSVEFAPQVAAVPEPGSALLHLYQRHGDQTPDHLRGMFAFAIWDRDARSLFIARDRLGVKPLYYVFDDDGTLFFASEIKALLAAGAVRPQLNRSAFPDYLANHAPSGEETLFAGVKRLLPGHTLTWTNGRITIRPYWDLSFAQPVDQRPDAELIAEYGERFREAVRLRLMADVPLGMFLSGGIDSAAITAAMATLVDEPIKTFSVAFHEREANELRYARLVAERYKTDHHEVLVTPEQFFGALPSLVWHEDEPLAHPSSVALNFVSRLAAEHVKVVLTGEGSDETLAGYGRYRTTVYNVALSRRWQSWAPGVVQDAVRNAIGILPHTSRLRRRMLRTGLALKADLD